METSTHEASRTSILPISPATRRRISSRAGGFGPLQLDLLDGLTTDRCGPEAALASHFQSQEREPVKTIQGICGPTSFASSAPVGPLSSWASRLQDRLATVGSTELPLIWKEKTTPAGRSIFRLAPSTRRTSDSGYIGAPWPTPQAGTPSQNGYNEAGSTDFSRKVDVIVGMRETPNGPRLPTPADACRRLPTTAATWPTPTVNDSRNGANATATRNNPCSKHHSGTTLVDATRLSGQTQNGSPEQTAKRGVLNPEFVFWLMGFPKEWQASASRAMQLFRKWPQRSSAP